jgi:hypothetical protein
MEVPTMQEWNDATDDIVLDDSLVAAAREETRERTEFALATALARLETLCISLAESASSVERCCAQQREYTQRFHEAVAAAPEPVPAADSEPIPEDVACTPPPADFGEAQTWERLLLGAQLCELAPLEDDRRTLLEGVLRRDADAVGLASRLMLVQVAAAEEVPSLLKEIGEAYYRWRPKTVENEDAFELALAAGLRQRSADVGLRNAIDLVHVGDRYDSSRHTSSDRGIEVASVRGWIVLRENGKALTKANVSLR